jgi:hypothetical protein
VATFFPTSSIYLVGAPRARHFSDPDAEVGVSYRELAAAGSQVRFIDGAELIAPQGVFSMTQPCLFFEPCFGPLFGLDRVSFVRAPDGGHFCPVPIPVEQGVIGSCPVFSSGALRYALSMLGPVLDELVPR